MDTYMEQDQITGSGNRRRGSQPPRQTALNGDKKKKGRKHFNWLFQNQISFFSFLFLRSQTKEAHTEGILRFFFFFYEMSFWYKVEQSQEPGGRISCFGWNPHEELGKQRDLRFWGGWAGRFILRGFCSLFRDSSIQNASALLDYVCWNWWDFLNWLFLISSVVFLISSVSFFLSLSIKFGNPAFVIPFVYLLFIIVLISFSTVPPISTCRDQAWNLERA